MKASDILSVLALSGSFASSKFTEGDSSASIAFDQTHPVVSDASSCHGSDLFTTPTTAATTPPGQAPPKDKDTCDITEKPQLDLEQLKLDLAGQDICPLVCTQEEGTLANGMGYRIRKQYILDPKCVADLLRREGATSEPQNGSTWTEKMITAALALVIAALSIDSVLLFNDTVLYLITPRKLITVVAMDENGNCLCSRCRPQ